MQAAISLDASLSLSILFTLVRLFFFLLFYD